jgi:hypothetical protein
VEFRLLGPLEVDDDGRPVAIEVPGDGFDWADAGIGAAGGIAILSILAGVAMVVTHRRHGPRLTA